MKSSLIGCAALGLMGIANFFITQDAEANDEFLAACEAFAEENDSEIDCACLNEAAQENPALYEEFAKVQRPEDVENISDEAKIVIAQCAAE